MEGFIQNEILPMTEHRDRNGLSSHRDTAEKLRRLRLDVKIPTPDSQFQNDKDEKEKLHDEVDNLIGVLKASTLPQSSESASRHPQPPIRDDSVPEKSSAPKDAEQNVHALFANGEKQTKQARLKPPEQLIKPGPGLDVERDASSPTSHTSRSGIPLYEKREAFSRKRRGIANEDQQDHSSPVVPSRERIEPSILSPDNTSLEDFKREVSQYMRRYVLDMYPELHTETYFVPPVLFNTPRSKLYDDRTPGSFVSDPTPESNTRAAESVERFLAAMQEMAYSANSTTTTSMAPSFVITGFLFEEYLKKLPPDNLFVIQLRQQGKERGKTNGEEEKKAKKDDGKEAKKVGKEEDETTEKKTKEEKIEEKKKEKRKLKKKEKKRIRDSLPFPRPRDCQPSLHRGEVDVLIVDKRHAGILAVEVKAVGDILGEHSDNVRKSLEKALQMIRKQRKVIMYLISDIPCAVPVSAMLVFPNLSRSRLKAVLDSDSSLRQEMAACLQTAQPVEDVCLCADDLPAKHSPTTDDDVERLSLWWSQHCPLRQQYQAPMDDDIYEEIIGRLAGPLSTVKTVTRQSQQQQQHQSQRIEVRTQGQAVAETARHFATLPLLPQLAELAWRCPKERVFLTGPPGSGKTLVLINKGAGWAREGSFVCVLTFGRASLPVAFVILDQIEKLLGQESDGKETKPGTVTLDSIRCRGQKEQMMESCSCLVSHLQQKAQGRRICFIMDELHVGLESTEKDDDDGNDNGYNDDDLVDVINQICSLVPGCGFWCAGDSTPLLIPSEFSVEHLDTLVRCPPAVQVLLKMTEPSRDKTPPAGPPTSSSSSSSSPPLRTQYSYRYVTHSTELAPYILPTTGVRNKLVSHDGHRATSILDCGECANQLARYLKKELRVGEDLSASDIMILTADTSALSGSQGEPLPRFARELREQAFDVKVIASATDQQRELASPPSDEIILTSCDIVSGLERKVVVFIPEGTPKDCKARDEPVDISSCYRNARDPDVAGKAAEFISLSDNPSRRLRSQGANPHSHPLQQAPGNLDNKPSKEHCETSSCRPALQPIENTGPEMKGKSTSACKRSSKKSSLDPMDIFFLEVTNHSDEDSEDGLENKGDNGGEKGNPIYISIAETDAKSGEKHHLVSKRRRRNSYPSETSCLPWPNDSEMMTIPAADRSDVCCVTPRITYTTEDALVSTSTDSPAGVLEEKSGSDLQSAQEGNHVSSVTSYETRLRRAVEQLSEGNRSSLWHAASRALGHAIVFCYTLQPETAVSSSLAPVYEHYCRKTYI